MFFFHFLLNSHSSTWFKFRVEIAQGTHSSNKGQIALRPAYPCLFYLYQQYLYIPYNPTMQHENSMEFRHRFSARFREKKKSKGKQWINNVQNCCKDYSFHQKLPVVLSAFFPDSDILACLPHFCILSRVFLLCSSLQYFYIAILFAYHFSGYYFHFF